MAFDPTTGNLVDADFIPADPTNLSTPKSAILSAGGNSVLVSDQLDDVVQEYALDGSYIGVFAPAGGVNTGDSGQHHRHRPAAPTATCW